MTDTGTDGAGPPGPDWWLASDGNWYPPETKPAGRPGSETSQGPGWWLASDGRWYPPESAAMRPPTPPTRVSKGLTGTLRGFLVASAVLGAIGGLVKVNEARTFTRVTGPSTAPVSDLTSAEDLSAGVVGLFGLAALTVVVLIIVWLYQSYKAVDAHGVAGTSWSAGWAVGGWFIPFANFVIPKLVVNEVDRISAAAVEGPLDSWRQQRTLGVANGWWVTFVIGSVLFVTGGGVSEAQLDAAVPDLDLYETGLWLQAAGLFAYGLAGFLGSTVVKSIGDRLR